MSENGITNVLLCGVGGQGVLLASELIIEVARRNGFEVKKSEIHGMAQRGGAVFTHIRFGRDVHSPIIPQAGADIVIAYEYVEILRYASLINKNTKTFVNTRTWVPQTVFEKGGTPYPTNVEEVLKGKGIDVKMVAAFDIASELGNAKAENVVLTAAAFKAFPFDKEAWTETIRLKFKPKLVEINLKAFEAGLTA